MQRHAGTLHARFASPRFPVRSRCSPLAVASFLALCLAPALAAPLPPGDLQIVTSGSAGELAHLDLDAGLEPSAAELAILRGRERVRSDNAAVYYLQAMLLLPERGERLRAVDGTPDRFEVLAREDYGEVLRSAEIDTLIRAALHCSTCDFQVDASGGAGTPLPHLREATWLIDYMAICADFDLARGRPWSALRRYGDMRAVSRDIASGAGLVSALTGMKLEATQQERFLDALPKLIEAGVPASSLETLYLHAERLAPTVRSAFSAESLFEDSIRKAISMLDGGRVDLFWAQLEELYGLRGAGSLREAALRQKALTSEQADDPRALASFAAAELRAYAQHVDRLVLLMEQPPAEREAALRKLHEDLVADLSQGIVARRFAPVLPQLAREIEAHQRKICAMQLLLAACAERVRYGEFPADLQALRTSRPEVCTKDRLNGGELMYAAEGETVTIGWSSEGPGSTPVQLRVTWPTE